jgi:hypothetical protein
MLRNLLVGMSISRVCSSTFVQVKVWISAVYIDFRPVSAYVTITASQTKQRCTMVTLPVEPKKGG